MDLTPLKSNLYLVSINKGDRNKGQFLTSQIRGPFDFLEMVQEVGFMYEQHQHHAKVVIAEKDRMESWLVCYDISDPKRLRKVARSLEGFGVRLQYSVFECPLDDMRLAKLKAELQDLVNHDEDQVLFVSLGPSAGDATLVIEAMGLPYEVRSRVTII